MLNDKIVLVLGASSGIPYATALQFAQQGARVMASTRRKHLIYISSISGLAPDTSEASYQAAKRVRVGFARAVRLEEKENGISTCVICPGMVDTELLEKRPVKPSPETLKVALQPEDVANAVIAVAKMPARAAIPEMQILPSFLQ